ncbi:MAG: hypothetical protein HY202_06890, partial [Nitrospirae bacterium]|nr:hypothetical protein [Nitrospirota bacterium]
GLFMDEKQIEFFFELPESLKPFGLAPRETTKQGVEEFIKRERALIMTEERPSPTENNLFNPNTTEMVIGGLKEIYGFPLKGLLLFFYKSEILDKLFCIFDHGADPDVDFFKILKHLENEVFGQPSNIQTTDQDTWEVDWNFKFFSISLILHRELPDLMLAFSDRCKESYTLRNK